MLGQSFDFSEVDWISVFGLSFVALILTVLGVVVSAEFGNTGLRVIDFAISGILTAALVVLYSRQAKIMDSQSDLLEQEMNREARKQHSETLRKRVEIWHGNPEKEVGDTPVDTPSNNTPTVGTRSFNSASGSYTPKFEDEPFHVIPKRLRDDRYLEDLLENHAPDLRETAEEISSLQAGFDETRAGFAEEFEIEINREYENFTIHETDDLSGWIFDLLVEQERGIFEDAIGRGISKVEDEKTSIYREERKVWFQIELRGGGAFSILGAEVKDEVTEDLQDIRTEVAHAGVEIMEDVFSEVENSAPFETVAHGASILDDGREAVNELERTLIEYHGRPIIPGDCKYLEEARAE